jgi:hypothetical protein
VEPGLVDTYIYLAGASYFFVVALPGELSSVVISTLSGVDALPNLRLDFKVTHQHPRTFIHTNSSTAFHTVRLYPKSIECRYGRCMSRSKSGQNPRAEVQFSSTSLPEAKVATRHTNENIHSILSGPPVG